MEYRNSLFPDESDEKTIAFIEKMKRLAPINSDNKIGYLEEIISYVNDLINGDEIRQYCSSTGPVSKYAKIAFQEIISDVHEQELESFRRERRELQTEIDSLSDRKETLNKEVDSLESKHQELKEQTGNMSLELAKLLKELQDKKENGIKEVNDAVSDEKKHLQDEIVHLSSMKENLISTVADLKKSLDDYNNIIAKLPISQEFAVWEPIKEGDPIYDTNVKTIDDYVKRLKLTYKNETRVTDEQCEYDFHQNAPFLDEFAKCVKKFTNPIPECSSVRAMINHKHWNEKSQKDVDELMEILKSLKMPTYQSIKANVDSDSIELGTIPNNINAMLRELYFQRIALEAVTKQRILEAELKSIVGLLMDVVPKDYDLRSLIETYSGFDQLLTDEINSYLDDNSKITK